MNSEFELAKTSSVVVANIILQGGACTVNRRSWWTINKAIIESFCPCLFYYLQD